MVEGEWKRLKLVLAPAHFQVGTWLCLKVVSVLASHIGLPLNQVGEGQVEGLRMFWSEETEIFLGEGNGKIVPFQGLVSLLGLSTLFCWVMDGAHRSLHSPEVPAGGGGRVLLFKSCLCFFSPS